MAPSGHCSGATHKSLPSQAVAVWPIRQLVVAAGIALAIRRVAPQFVSVHVFLASVIFRELGKSVWLCLVSNISVEETSTCLVAHSDPGRSSPVETSFVCQRSNETTDGNYTDKSD
jgi:hypothetical protein